MKKLICVGVLIFYPTALPFEHSQKGVLVNLKDDARFQISKKSFKRLKNLSPTIKEIYYKNKDHPKIDLSELPKDDFNQILKLNKKIKNTQSVNRLLDEVTSLTSLVALYKHARSLGIVREKLILGNRRLDEIIQSKIVSRIHDAKEKEEFLSLLGHNDLDQKFLYALEKKTQQITVRLKGDQTCITNGLVIYELSKNSHLIQDKMEISSNDQLNLPELTRDQFAGLVDIFARCDADGKHKAFLKNRSFDDLCQLLVSINYFDCRPLGSRLIYLKRNLKRLIASNLRVAGATERPDLWCALYKLLDSKTCKEIDFFSKYLDADNYHFFLADGVVAEPCFFKNKIDYFVKKSKVLTRYVACMENKDVKEFYIHALSKSQFHQLFFYKARSIDRPKELIEVLKSAHLLEMNTTEDEVLEWLAPILTNGSSDYNWLRTKIDLDLPEELDHLLAKRIIDSTSRFESLKMVLAGQSRSESDKQALDLLGIPYTEDSIKITASQLRIVDWARDQQEWLVKTRLGEDDRKTFETLPKGLKELVERCYHFTGY